MKTEETKDLTYDDLMTGLPEDFAVKYKEIIVILLAQMLEITKDEGELFIKVWSRLLSIQARVLAKEAAEKLMTDDRGWN